MSDIFNELHDEELFDPDQMEHVVTVVWWLTHLLGGRVVVSRDSDFWLQNYPDDARLTMRVENGELVMYAETSGED